MSVDQAGRAKTEPATSRASHARERKSFVLALEHDQRLREPDRQRNDCCYRQAQSDDELDNESQPPEILEQCPVADMHDVRRHRGDLLVDVLMQALLGRVPTFDQTYNPVGPMARVAM
jgi:hypothetical protein